MRFAFEAWRGDRLGCRGIIRQRNVAATIAGNPFHKDTILSVIAKWLDGGQRLSSASRAFINMAFVSAPVSVLTVVEKSANAGARSLGDG